MMIIVAGTSRSSLVHLNAAQRGTTTCTGGTAATDGGCRMRILHDGGASVKSAGNGIIYVCCPGVWLGSLEERNTIPTLNNRRCGKPRHDTDFDCSSYPCLQSKKEEGNAQLHLLTKQANKRPNVGDSCAFACVALQCRVSIYLGAAKTRMNQHITCRSVFQAGEPAMPRLHG